MTIKLVQHTQNGIHFVGIIYGDIQRYRCTSGAIVFVAHGMNRSRYAGFRIVSNGLQTFLYVA